MTSETGHFISYDGQWRISWDHTGNAMMTYTVEDLEDGGTYICHFDVDLQQWRARPSYMATIDMERGIPNDAEYYTLIIALNKASGREKIPGVHQL